MRTPKWIQNLKWNAEVLTEKLGEKLGSPAVNLEPEDQEVADYFHSYIQEARELIVPMITMRNRLTMMLKHLDSERPGSSERDVYVKSIQCVDVMLEGAEGYLEDLTVKIQALLALNGYQDGQLLLPANAPVQELERAERMNARIEAILALSAGKYEN